MPDHKFELLNAYLDGELNPQQRRKFEAHLESCEECQAELESLESLSGMLAEAPLPEFPAPDQLPPMSPCNCRVPPNGRPHPAVFSTKPGGWLPPDYCWHGWY